MGYRVNCYLCGQHGKPDKLHTYYLCDDAEEALLLANKWEEAQDNGYAEILERPC